jgi:mannose-6-phosphate isomerase
MSHSAVRPLKVADNRIPVFYAGGAKINKFRAQANDVQGPEDWVGSITKLPPSILPQGANSKMGTSVTEEGFLDDLITANPQAWLGEELSAIMKDNSSLLVKLLDAGERLPIHAHPTRDFAKQHLSSFFGKTEGWIVLDTDPGSKIWLGMREEISAEELALHIQDQSIEKILGLMNEYTVSVGQVIYVPAGTLHAIGPGTLIAECQEPTSFSILCEYKTFGLSENAATLGLGWEKAISGLTLKPDPYANENYFPKERELLKTDSSNINSLFAKEGDEFFRALRVITTSEVTLPSSSFSILIVSHGSGHLIWNAGEIAIRSGETFVIPAAATGAKLVGDVGAILFLPPLLS